MENISAIQKVKNFINAEIITSSKNCDHRQIKEYMGILDHLDKYQV